MISIFKRVLKVAESETHSAIDKMENPIKMTEQGIRDLKNDYHSGLKSLAEVKALSIRLRKDFEQSKQQATDYERKAMLLLAKGQKGELAVEEAERLAQEALNKKENAAQRAASLQGDLTTQEKSVAQLESNLNGLKSQITQWENELVTLKARSKVASSTRKLNQQLAGIDSRGTISMLEKMKNKTQEEEALAQSYGEIAAVETSIDSEIDQALGSSSNSSQSLNDLKVKMGLS